MFESVFFSETDIGYAHGAHITGVLDRFTMSVLLERETKIHIVRGVLINTNKGFICNIVFFCYEFGMSLWTCYFGWSGVLEMPLIGMETSFSLVGNNRLSSAQSMLIECFFSSTILRKKKLDL